MDGQRQGGDPSVTLTPEFLALVHQMAEQVQHYIARPSFGERHADGRTVATFDQMSRLGSDASIANHLVTLGFRDLSRMILGYTHPPVGIKDFARFTPDMAARYGDTLLSAKDRTPPPSGWPDANFFTFATWASLTIGRNVRNRFAPRLFDPETSGALRGAFNRLAIDVRQSNNGQLSRLLMEAQRVGFEEIVRAVRELWTRTPRLTEVMDATVRSEALVSLDRRQALMRLERAERDLAALLGQHPLVREEQRMSIRDRDERYADLQHGMVGYFLARRAHEARQYGARAELIFRSNVQIEAYVQRKVQSVLDYSADGIASDYFRQRFGISSSERARAGRWRRRLNRAAVASFERRFGDAWSRLLTDQVLVARVGDELIRLGRDLPDPPGASSFFPEVLDTLHDSWAGNLVLRFDHSFGDGAGTAAHRWGDFDDRMNWLVNLLRSRQRSSVWKEPFTESEEMLVRARQDPSAGLQGVLPWML